MSANNCVYITKDRKGYWLYDRDVDLVSGVLPEPFGMSGSLKGAIKLAQEYMGETTVEYGIEFGESVTR